MAKKTQSKKQTTKATKAVSAKARKAPGNAKALQDKAADNVAKLRKQSGRVEAISSVVAARTGNGLVVTTSRDRSIVITRIDGTVTKLALMGQPVQPLEEYLKNQPKPQARLAQGVEGKMTENSRKAVEDQKTAAAKTAKATKVAAPKAAKNKAPARGADRDYTRGKTAIAAKPDSWRHHMLTVITKHGNTAKAKAAHEKSGKFSANKLDFNWAAAQGYIAFSK
jgi:hypothetical protein